MVTQTDRLITHIIALFILILLITTSVNADEDKKKTFLVGYAQDTMANDWRAAQVRQLQEEFSKHPDIRFIFTDAGGNTARQIQDIEDLAFQKVDVLMTSPRDAKLSAPVISKVYRQGIPVVLVTRGIESSDYTSLVAPDDSEIARDAARYMAKKMKGKGRIIILKGIPTATTAIARTTGFMNEIKKYPGIKVIAVKDANYLRADAIRETGNILKEGIEFDAIYSQSDSMATGARIALVKAGIDPGSKLIVGIDYISEAQQAIRKGEQDASFVYPTSAKQAVDVVVNILHGRKVAKRVMVRSQQVTRKNVDIVNPIF